MDNQPTPQSGQPSAPVSQPVASPPPPVAPAPPAPQPAPEAPPKEFTKQDLESLYKGPLGSPLTTHMPNMTKLTPEQAAAVTSEWHNSKIVKFGSIFLYLFWAAVIGGMFKLPGLAALILVTVGIYTSYRLYKKNKSPLAWAIFVGLLFIVVVFMVLASRGSIK